MSVTEQAPATRPAQHAGRRHLTAYHASGDRRARERAVESYMPLARKLAAQYHRNKEPLEDLQQVAYLGLVKAVDRFDPARGSNFASFARPTISGELRRHLRDTTWKLHVPRAVQEATLAVAKATPTLTASLGRAPTVAEIARETGLDVEAVTEALQARSVQDTTSIDRPVSEDGDSTLGDLIGGDDERLGRVDQNASLQPLMAALPARERAILHLRFTCDLTQSEIAERIGCSQMQISRLLRRTLERLAAGASPPALDDAPQDRESGAALPAG